MRETGLPAEIELRLCTEIARYIKKATGKGPKDVKAAKFYGYIVIIVKGSILPLEKEASKTQSGYMDVKINRIKLVHTVKGLLIEKVSLITGENIIDLFYDVNPLSENSIFLFVTKES